MFVVGFVVEVGVEVVFVVEDVVEVEVVFVVDMKCEDCGVDFGKGGNQRWRQ